MESRIPVPTDNIFKFYALFGLLLFAFSCGSILFVNATSNAAIMASIPELESLRELAELSRSEKAKVAVLERKIEITNANRGFYNKVIGIFAGLAMIAMAYGFQRWHTRVQPVLDETAKVQLDLAKMQLEKLRRELGVNPETPVPSGEVPVSKPNIP
jgi:hypothetical protein